MRNMTPKQLVDYMGQAEKKPVLLDVREVWEYKTCHIDGSQLVSMRTIPARLHEFKRDEEIVAICHHGNRSAMVANFMEQQGFDKMINLAGGVNAWAKEIDQSMPTY